MPKWTNEEWGVKCMTMEELKFSMKYIARIEQILDKEFSDDAKSSGRMQVLGLNLWLK